MAVNEVNHLEAVKDLYETYYDTLSETIKQIVVREKLWQSRTIKLDVVKEVTSYRDWMETQRLAKWVFDQVAEHMKACKADQDELRKYGIDLGVVHNRFSQVLPWVAKKLNRLVQTKFPQYNSWTNWAKSWVSETPCLDEMLAALPPLQVPCKIRKDKIVS